MSDLEIKIPGIVNFRKCTLSDQELCSALSDCMQRLYNGANGIILRHIPARPNEDFDLLIGEAIYRLMQYSEPIYVTPYEAWDLKNAGYPQPEVKHGQRWTNSVMQASIIDGVIAEIAICKSVQEVPHKYKMQTPFKHCAYMPPIQDVPGYEKGMASCETVEQWIKNRSEHIEQAS